MSSETPNGVDGGEVALNDAGHRVTNGHQSGLWNRDNETTPMHCSSPSQTLSVAAAAAAESENDRPAAASAAMLASLAEPPFNNSCSGGVMDVDDDAENNPGGNESVVEKNLLANSCMEVSVIRSEDYSCSYSMGDGSEQVEDNGSGDSSPGLRMNGSSESLMRRIPGATEKDSPSCIIDRAAEGLFPCLSVFVAATSLTYTIEAIYSSTRCVHRF